MNVPLFAPGDDPEVGMGPLCGPVVAAAVLVKPHTEDRLDYMGIMDELTRLGISGTCR